MPLLDFWVSLARFASLLAPPVGAAFLEAVKQLRERLPESQVERLIAAGDVIGISALLFTSDTGRSAFTDFRDAIRESIQRSALRFAKDIPASRQLRVQLDVFDPRTVAGIRAFEQTVIDKTGQTLSDAVRGAVEAGLREGVNPRTIARGIRDVVGLTKEQEVWVRNFRDELVRGDIRVFERQLLDQRFVTTLRKAFANGGLSREQIDRMVASYRKRTIAYHAETVARTVAINSMKEGQLAIWQQAIDQGVIDDGDLTVTWRTKMDGRERDTHAAMNGTTIRFGERWLVPGVGLVRYPGEREFNCRCVPVYRVTGRRQPPLAA